MTMASYQGGQSEARALRWARALSRASCSHPPGPHAETHGHIKVHMNTRAHIHRQHTDTKYRHIDT